MADNKPRGRVTVQLASGPVVVVDAASQLAASDAERIAVVAEPCGKLSVMEALRVRPAALFLVSLENDADEAGLGAADASGIPCAAVTSTPLHQGDGHALWLAGKVAAANAAARRRGVKQGMTVQQAAGLLMAWNRVA